MAAAAMMAPPPGPPPSAAVLRIYKGTFSHALLGGQPLPLEVSVTSATDGFWSAAGQHAEITITQQGDTVTFSEKSVQLLGQDSGTGLIKGIVAVMGQPGGEFELR